MTARQLLDEAFSRLAALADDALPLGEGALRIAADEYPDLDIAGYLARLDALAAAAQPHLPPGASPAETLSLLVRFMHDGVGLRGNQADYYDPRNSYLNDVLDRGLGIPITLSVILIEAGQRLGLPLAGVALPGHFVVRWRGEDLFADPFDGQVVDRDGCVALVRGVYGRSVEAAEEWLVPVSSRPILTRMLYNLKAIWIQQSDVARAIQVVRRLVLLNPAVLDEARDLGLLYRRDGQRGQALYWLQQYMTARPDAPDAEQIRQVVERLVDELARWN